MAMALEALGLSPVGYNAIPAVHPEKERATKEAGKILAWAIAHDWKPKDFLTRKSFLNAIAAVAATGGAPTPSSTSSPWPRKRGWSSAWTTLTRFPARPR